MPNQSVPKGKSQRTVEVHDAILNASRSWRLPMSQVLPFEAELVLATLMDSQLTAADTAADATVQRVRYAYSLFSNHEQHLPA